MAETPFEAALNGLFAASPDYEDAEVFLGLLAARLEADARRRGIVLGGLGMAGAVVATAAFARSDVPGMIYGWVTAMPSEVTLISLTIMTAAMLLIGGAMILAPVVVGSVEEA